MLLEAGASVWGNMSGKVLVQAASCGQGKCVEKLIAGGANIASHINEAMVAAAMRGHWAVLSILIDEGLKDENREIDGDYGGVMGVDEKGGLTGGEAESFRGRTKLMAMAAISST